MGNLHSNAAGTSSHVESSKKHHRKSISGSDISPRSKSKPTMPSFTKNILFLGLDSAGKSTIIARLQSAQKNDWFGVQPTIGSTMTNFRYKDASFNIWDVGGKQDTRQMWQVFLADARALVYVIDITDVARVDEAKRELNNIMNSAELAADVPVLVLVNKSELPGCPTHEESIKMLELNKLQRKWALFLCSAFEGNGLHDAVQWLYKTSVETQRNSGEMIVPN
eukprot:TRINITY_DN658_c0_g1_i1.p1 TRINITY_DN658_c0_g1~~TRINITY_DN658_c0_g1_i1.p1  ORF type:complete len:223 (-),score=50.16 TRINITY_DN658_c0_g1_i1:313-981(-)